MLNILATKGACSGWGGMRRGIVSNSPKMRTQQMKGTVRELSF